MVKKKNNGMKILYTIAIISSIFLLTTAYASVWWTGTPDFVYNETSDFDNATLVDVLGEQDMIRLGGKYFENFDNETDGDSPPDSWTLRPGTDCTVKEVDDANYYSAPNSFKMSNGASTLNGRIYCHDMGDNAYPTTWSVWTYVDDASQYYYPLVVYASDNSAAIGIYFRNDNSIRSYDDTSFTDTGTNYVTDQWVQIRVEADWSADTFDAWYGGTQIINDWGIYDHVNGMDRICVGINQATTAWFDDIEVGTNTSGTWTSNTTYTSNALSNVSINLTADSDHYLDKIEFLNATDDVLIHSNDTDIQTTGVYTYEDVSTVDKDFKIKLYLIGNGSTSPIINDVIGYYEAGVISETLTTNLASPLNISYCGEYVWVNATTDNTSTDWCGYQIDNDTNITMTNSSGNWNAKYRNYNCSDNAHNITIYCNSTSGVNGTSDTEYFWSCCCDNGSETAIGLGLIIIIFTLFYIFIGIDKYKKDLTTEAFKLLFMGLGFSFITAFLYSLFKMSEYETQLSGMFKTFMIIMIIMFMGIFIFSFIKVLMEALKIWGVDIGKNN